MEKKLTIDQLKNYLGTGLKINRLWITAYGGFNRQELELTVLYHCRLDQIVPHCYRLSDLDKFIPELGFVPIEELDKLNLGHCDWISKERGHWIEKYGIDRWLEVIPFAIIKKLFQWHFWPFGDEYFEAGLVIDKLKP